jgi:hypothetical protein
MADLIERQFKKEMGTRMFKRLAGIFPFVVLLAACGSGGDDHTPTAGADNGPGPTTPTGPVIQSVTVQTSSPQIASNGSAAADITALVRDSKNQFLEGAVVSFSSNSGGLAVTQATTDVNGVAKATLSPAGDPTNRTIIVTATASAGTTTSTTTGPMTGTATDTVNVDVIGSQLTVSGPASLALNDVGSYSVSLKDSGGVGIGGQTINISSSRSNSLTPSSLTTNSSGAGTFTLTAANGGTDTIGVSGLGLTGSQTTTISVDQFAFSAPATNAEIALNTPQTITLRWSQAGVPQVGQTIIFASTRGTLGAATAVTNGSGDASVTIQSANAGFATLSATAASGVTTQRVIEFVATTPTAIDVQASPFTIATAESSTITAVVRDALGNLVKNRFVQFALQDVTGGQLSQAAVRTDSQGRATTTYTASSSTSATNGVQITGTVQGTAVADTVALTVARREVFISLGTGNEIEEPFPAQYSMTYVVQVTDAGGNGVANSPLTMEIVSTDYRKGVRNFPPGGTRWSTPATIVCTDEDSDRDGVLDPGEDINGNDRIEAGNIALVTNKVTTNANGFALVEVLYPQEHAYWLSVRLSASTTVQGSEFVRSVNFLLPGSADDFNDEDVAPPGPTSPFGIGPCTSPN